VEAKSRGQDEAGLFDPSKISNGGATVCVLGLRPSRSLVRPQRFGQVIFLAGSGTIE